MNEKRTTRPSSKKLRAESDENDRTDWAAVRKMGDVEAAARADRDPDAPPTDPDFLRKARITHPAGQTKISLYVDNDVLSWFKKGGRGYQTRLNAVLRAYVEAVQSES